jgi:hypothetical protein
MDTNDEKKPQGTLENDLMGMGDLDIFDQEEENLFDLSDFDGLEDKKDESPDDENQDEDSNKKTELDDKGTSDEIDFNKSSDDQEEQKKLDVEALNKAMDTNFQTEEELREFLKGKTQEKNIEKEEEDFKKANETLELYNEIIVLEDEALMRKQYEVLAIQNKQDLNDQDVIDEIEEKINELKDTNTLTLYAEKLRNGIKEQQIEPNKQTVEAITKRREEHKIAEEKKQEKLLQDSFVKIFKTGNFYGIDVKQDDVVRIYQDVPKFLELIQSDKNAQAELATLWNFREEIYKKAAGLKYEDGMKAIVEEFTKSAKSKSENLTHARKQGSAVSGDVSSLLIEDLLYTKDVEDEK